MPLEPCHHLCPCCKREWSHQVDYRAELDDYSRECADCAAAAEFRTRAACVDEGGEQEGRAEPAEVGEAEGEQERLEEAAENHEEVRAEPMGEEGITREAPLPADLEEVERLRVLFGAGGEGAGEW